IPRSSRPSAPRARSPSHSAPELAIARRQPASCADGRSGGSVAPIEKGDDMPAPLTARHHAVEADDALEFCFAKGWTDGLPVVPPTADRVGAMLAGARLAPTQEIGFVAHR